MGSLAAAPKLSDAPASRLRLILTIGFSGIALIFLVATLDSVRLLQTMRAENTLLRQSALDRSNHLAAIRSSILLTNSYLGDYLLDSDRREADDHLAQIQQVWSGILADLAHYQSSSLDEAVLVKELGTLLDQHWRFMNQVMQSPNDALRNPAFYKNQMLPLRSSIVEITTRLDGIDSRQTAATEAQIQSEFEQLGSRLSTVLLLGLGAAVLLALGCLAYIFRIERQNRSRYREVLRARESLEQLSARLVETQETERRTISRELHDQVGQTLNAVLVEAANLAKRLPPDDAISARYLDNIRQFADSSVNSIRDIALLLRPSMLDDLGLIPALEWQAREVSRRSGTRVKVAADDVPDGLSDSWPDEMRTGIYRVVQEALQNIQRHSHAKNAKVAVQQEDSEIVLTVEDDGIGFDPGRTRGLGMLGMEERIRQLGGRLEVQSSPAKGTTIRATLPVPVPAH